MAAILSREGWVKWHTHIVCQILVVKINVNECFTAHGTLSYLAYSVVKSIKLYSLLLTRSQSILLLHLLSGVPDLWDHNKILRCCDLSHLQVPDCIWVFFYFVWFVFIHNNFQFYFKWCTIVTFWIFTYYDIWIVLIIYYLYEIIELFIL